MIGVEPLVEQPGALPRLSRDQHRAPTTRTAPRGRGRTAPGRSRRAAAACTRGRRVGGAADVEQPAGFVPVDDLAPDDTHLVDAADADGGLDEALRPRRDRARHRRGAAGGGRPRTPRAAPGASRNAPARPRGRGSEIDAALAERLLQDLRACRRSNRCRRRAPPSAGTSERPAPRQVSRSQAAASRATRTTRTEGARSGRWRLGTAVMRGALPRGGEPSTGLDAENAEGGPQAPLRRRRRARSGASRALACEPPSSCAAGLRGGRLLGAAVLACRAAGLLPARAVFLRAAGFLRRPSSSAPRSSCAPSVFLRAAVFFGGRLPGRGRLLARRRLLAAAVFAAAVFFASAPACAPRSSSSLPTSWLLALRAVALLPASSSWLLPCCFPHLSLADSQDAMRFRRRRSRSLMPPHTP